MNFQTMNSQRKLILVAAVAGVISVFLPWVTVSIFGESNSINGFRGIGIIVFLAFIAVAGISVMGNQSNKLDKTMWLGALGGGAIAFLFTLISFGTITDGGGMGFVSAGYGFGIWIALIASLGIVAFAWFYKNPQDNIMASLESLKKNTFTAGSSAGTNKISELERLIELKSQGKITEEEYRELKSKII
jgi:hypothetical protein